MNARRAKHRRRCLRAQELRRFALESGIAPDDLEKTIHELEAIGFLKKGDGPLGWRVTDEAQKDLAGCR